MNLVDWVMLGVLVMFALVGWRRGFISGLMSFAGFLAGALAAAFVLPPLVGAAVSSEIVRAIAVGVGVLACALVGQIVASILGDRLRATVSWRPARLVDNIAGATLNVLALALVSWIVASAVAYMPSSRVSQEFTDSTMLGALDSLMPNPARDAFGQLRDMAGTSSVPRIFSGLVQATGPDVVAPDPEAVTAEVRNSRGSVVQVVGDAIDCATDRSGSGFVFAPGRVMTNAHVVAGEANVAVRLPDGRQVLPAEVVYFDPKGDVAVLLVPGLAADPLPFARDEASTGDSAVVAGYPLAGPYRAEPARVRAVIDARGEDIYGGSGVDRQVYSVRGRVQPGNSGGPLLDPKGRVLGLVFGADSQGGTTGFALTAAGLKDAVRGGRMAVGAVGTGTCNIRE